MKTFPLVAMVGGLVLGLSPSASLFAQEKPGMCPPPGWAEGLVRYTNPGFAFPTDDTARVPTPNCNFHMWSWEAFVWATALDPDTGNARFLSLPTFDDLAGLPGALKKGPGSLVLRPRDLKPKEGREDEQIGSITQAGSQGILVDQNGQAIYYSSHMDDSYFKFARQYYGVAKYEKAAPTLTFPVGAAVFKAAWQIVPAGTTRTNAYTTFASVPILVAGKEGGVVIPPNPKYRQVTVALVGLHVVGVTVNHPESLWGTFEQVQNAPDLPPGADPKGAQKVSDQGFTFYKAGTAAKDCNQSAKISLTDPAKQTLSPITNVFRQFGWGDESKLGMKEIDDINAQSQGAVKNFPVKAEAVFANYKLIGTAWLKPSIPPSSLKPGDGDMDKETIGSVSLANATLETFVQGRGTNCFSCHNTGGVSGFPGKDINFSHMLLHPLAKAKKAATAVPPK